jgi:hypothetical protein
VALISLARVLGDSVLYHSRSALPSGKTHPMSALPCCHQLAIVVTENVPLRAVETLFLTLRILYV